MKPRSSQRFAAYLLDELGGIEDRYLAEAQTPYQAKKTCTVRRVLIVVLSLTLTLTVVLSALLIGSLRGAKSEDMALDDGEAIGQTEQVLDFLSPSAGATATTLSTRLGELRASTESLQIAEEELTLFDGQAKVIWKYTEDESYRVQTLTDAEYQQLTQELGSANSKLDTAEEQSLAGIWLAAGDGTVISPQLQQTAGNVGYGTLFAYRPEIEPSAAFTELLCDILSSVGNTNGREGYR